MQDLQLSTVSFLTSGLRVSARHLKRVKQRNQITSITLKNYACSPRKTPKFLYSFFTIDVKTVYQIWTEKINNFDTFRPQNHSYQTPWQSTFRSMWKSTWNHSHITHILRSKISLNVKFDTSINAIKNYAKSWNVIHKSPAHKSYFSLTFDAQSVKTQLPWMLFPSYSIKTATFRLLCLFRNPKLNQPKG